MCAETFQVRSGHSEMPQCVLPYVSGWRCSCARRLCSRWHYHALNLQVQIMYCVSGAKDNLDFHNAGTAHNVCIAMPAKSPSSAGGMRALAEQSMAAVSGILQV